MIRVLLADAEALIRSGLALLLRHEPGFEVVGSAADGLSAVRLAHEQRPDVVLMDVRMPGIDGIEATRRITADEDLAGVRVLVLTTPVMLAVATVTAGLVCSTMRPAAS